MRLANKRKNDIMVCKTKTDDTANAFAVFALIVKNNPNDRKMTIRRYLNFGHVYIGAVTWDYSKIESYYQDPNENEKSLFSPQDPITVAMSL